MYSNSVQGLLIGLGLAAIIIAFTIISEGIRPDVALFAIGGAVVGVFLARMFLLLVVKIDNPGLFEFLNKYSLLINLGFAIMGSMIGIQKGREFFDILDKDVVIKGKTNSDVKILDTSILIDGRIVEVIETGFLGGKFLVPQFVLHELQMVADSADATKRQRGRRGLDILKRIQDINYVTIKIYEKDYPHIAEVDSKILELAKELGARIATTDFNLSKVAALQGVSVLNANDLAQALKPVVLPGDAVSIFLAKEGKERSQAVGYLDDGTMIVVEDGRKLVGKRVNIHVNSVLQTSAGRMIFARVQNGREIKEPDQNFEEHFDKGKPPASQDM
jgi:uncharacterized protein YacL